MKKLFFILLGFMLCITAALQAQVTIGSNVAPDKNALLDLKNQANVDASTKGLLLPRVKLTSTANAAPLTAHTYGMIVFNTAKVNDVDSAFYYNDGKKWVRIAAATGSFWGLKGNAATDSAANFIGTTDAKKPLIFRTDNTPRMIMSSTGNVGIGTTTPGAKLDINGIIRIQGGSPAAGRVLTSDATGKASWQSITTNTYISVSSTIDPNILGYIPSETATAATNAPATLAVGSATATLAATGTFTENGHSYATYSTNTMITWYDAYNAAKNLGGYLATFTTDPEWIYVETNLLTPYPIFNTHSAWIGMCKFSWFAGPAMTPDPEIKWITGEQPLHDYSAGGNVAVRKTNYFANIPVPEPNNVNNTEGFVHTYPASYPNSTRTIKNYTTTHAWNDTPATGNSSVLGFIVEFNH